MGTCKQSGAYPLTIYTFLNTYQPPSTPPLYRLVARISSHAIKIGVVPCVIALVLLVTYTKAFSLSLFFGYMLGRVYTSTMLYSLIYREKLFSDGELMNVDSTFHLSMTC